MESEVDTCSFCVNIVPYLTQKRYSDIREEFLCHEGFLHQKNRETRNCKIIPKKYIFFLTLLQ